MSNADNNPSKQDLHFRLQMVEQQVASLTNMVGVMQRQISELQHHDPQLRGKATGED